jgi:hypothetical protein
VSQDRVDLELQRRVLEMDVRMDVGATTIDVPAVVFVPSIRSGWVEKVDRPKQGSTRKSVRNPKYITLCSSCSFTESSLIFRCDSAPRFQYVDIEALEREK